jgi:hypothetical protein
VRLQRDDGPFGPPLGAPSAGHVWTQPHYQRRTPAVLVVATVVCLSLTAAWAVGGSEADVHPGAHAYLNLQPDGVTPVTYDPCVPISYVVRSAHAPEGAAELIEEAVSRVSDATGLEFVDEGVTSETPTEPRAAIQPEQYGNGWAPVLIAFQTEGENPLVAGTVIGLGGSQAELVGRATRFYVTGSVRLDAAWFAEAMETRYGRAQARATLLHELGHLVGLAHVNDRSQLMFESGGAVRDFQGGDLDGLAELVRGPCIADID